MKVKGGSEFQRRVWAEIAKIPKGRVVTYGELARLIGRPQAVRAVASACGANPNPVVVPCHRVVGKTGIGGYSGPGGVERKRELLKREGVVVD